MRGWPPPRSRRNGRESWPRPGRTGRIRYFDASRCLPPRRGVSFRFGRPSTGCWWMGGGGSGRRKPDAKPCACWLRWLRNWMQRCWRNWSRPFFPGHPATCTAPISNLRLGTRSWIAASGCDLRKRLKQAQPSAKKEGGGSMPSRHSTRGGLQRMRMTNFPFGAEAVGSVIVIRGSHSLLFHARGVVCWTIC